MGGGGGQNQDKLSIYLSNCTSTLRIIMHAHLRTPNLSISTTYPTPHNLSNTTQLTSEEKMGGREPALPFLVPKP